MVSENKKSFTEWLESEKNYYINKSMNKLAASFNIDFKILSLFSKQNVALY